MNKRTIKALEELVKTEHMAIAALDSALEEVEDNRLRKNYKKWRDSHIKQAQALNDRLEDLGGEPIPYEVGTGKGQATLWGKITGLREDTSLAGMRIGAERGIKRYVDHLDEIDDAKALNIIRKNLEAKQDEIEWYDEMTSKERVEKLDTKLETSREKVVELEHAGNGKKKGGFPLPLLLVAGAVGAAAFVLLRKGDEDEWDDYGEDAFTYETEEAGTDSGYTSAGTYTAGGEQTS
ncbi:MAG TPA: ferritin-like domain-containing protein [Chloroflexia bacterium]|nr:ferritin-like domain-containing protein [Chloroflexia bacterium]